MVRMAERNSCYTEVVEHSDFLMQLGGVGCLLRYRMSGVILLIVPIKVAVTEKP